MFGNSYYLCTKNKTIMANDILNSKKDGLSIFYNSHGVDVDKELPKYSIIKKMLSEEKKQENTVNMTPDGEIRTSFKEQDSIRDIMRNYERIRLGEIREVNIFLSKHIFNDVFSGLNEFKSAGVAFGMNEVEFSEGGKKKKRSIFSRLSDILKTKSKELENVYSIDVIEFFSQVKGLTKANKDKYVNRLTGYIVALKNCDASGQTALKEKLIRDMVINKYESVLYANDMYYVVTEDQVVDFVKKTQKGVRLTYVKNYMRNIPSEVVKKMEDANLLEIFDNYCILHYDPDERAFSETIDETRRRRDPILFGVIRGSNKLYYITDWIDEYCDLTLDKFVETLQIDKESLKMEETL